MSWTYDLGQLQTSPLFQVRFLCGDTDSSVPLVQDEEIAFILSGQPLVTLAAAQVCDAIAGRFSQDVDASASELSESASQRAEAFAARAKQLRKSSYKFALPSFGGLTKSGKEALDQDVDLVQPSFRIGMGEHPGLPQDRALSLPWWTWPS